MTSRPRSRHRGLLAAARRGRQPLVPVLLALGILLTVADAHAAQKSKAARAQAKAKASTLVLEPKLEPRAIDLLKATSARLAAAQSMRFTAVVSYENPSLLGPPLVYTTKSEVTLQRPDKLRVITSGDGPPTEFYDDGKIMMALAPAENLVAVAEAPPTIDGALKAAYDSAAIYYPFSDLIVADPYGDIADKLKWAFYIGQSHVVGGVTTDMLAYASDTVFVQMWVGAEDTLPRRVRAIYRNDPARLRHQMDLADWQLDLSVPGETFGSLNAANAKRIGFARPDPPRPAPAAPAPAKAKKPAKPQ